MEEGRGGCKAEALWYVCGVCGFVDVLAESDRMIAKCRAYKGARKGMTVALL